MGSSFSNHTGITPKKPIIQVDFDRMALGKFHAVDLPVWGDIGETAAAVLHALPETLRAADQQPEVAERWSLWRQEKTSRLADDLGNGVNSAAVFHVLGDLTPADAVIAVDVGNNTYSFGRYFESKGQRVLMSGYLGSIGFSFPAAMGAWAATRDFEALAGRKVISVSGDGGFGQYLGDFTTAVKYNMDITHILLNNAELGKISKEQRAGEWPVWETDLHNPDFAAFAELCGAKGLKVTDASQLNAAIGEALDHDGPALVEIVTDAELI
jgi:thiamine pyrophosphate-dependent acetolactate synthase large subunit-like protein